MNVFLDAFYHHISLLQHLQMCQQLYRTKSVNELMAETTLAVHIKFHCICVNIHCIKQGYEEQQKLICVS